MGPPLYLDRDVHIVLGHGAIFIDNSNSALHWKQSSNRNMSLERVTYTSLGM